MKEYLQWVSTFHYPTIGSFIAEAKEMGVSKRIINFRMAAKLAKEDSCIYLVHNNGHFSHCFACSVAQECSFCKGRYEVCAKCKGLGTVEKATGGWAVVDGVRWDYCKYIKLRRQSWHKFWKEEHKIGAISPCRTCGGKGRIPVGEIFGCFVPEEIVYLPGGNENNQLLQSYREAGIRFLQGIDLQVERERLSGWKEYRGFYAVADGIIQFDQTYLYQQKLHRGLKIIDFKELIS